MPGIAFRIDDGDLRRIDRRAASIEQLGDTTPLMAEIAGSMEATTQHAFETETAPDGTPWKPSIRAQIEGGQTLTDSARLRQSIHRSWGRDYAEVGSDVIYAGIHQTGGEIRPVNAKALAFMIGGELVQVKKVTIPARPFLGVDDGDLGEIIGEFLAGGFA